MHISGPIPFHVARAYGLPSTDRPQLGKPVVQNRGAGIADTPHPSTQSATNNAGPLIAGKVPGGVDFTGAVPTTGPSLSLYNRAADRVEAATAITIGRSLDLRA